MCYDDKAQPPIPPGVNGKAHGEEIVLTAQDGNRFAAYIAQPDQPATAQILIYPDAYGLRQFYKDLALRFAEVGIRALVLDYFGRTAGLAARDESFEYMPHIQQIQISNFFLDVQAALDYLNAEQSTRVATFTVGFCMGGAFSLQTGMQNFDLTGLIAFYAGLTGAFGGGKTVLEQADRIHYPVLGLFGENDNIVSASAVHQLDEALDTAGVEHTIVIYPGATHSFFDRLAADYAEASEDAWKRILTFIASHKATA
ncbi:MAG TPA: dienelactone hydrolase family protein [Ktedonobacteraceae bacterium]|jgi:carboxymethylenebutenolidase